MYFGENFKYLRQIEKSKRFLCTHTQPNSQKLLFSFFTQVLESSKSYKKNCKTLQSHSHFMPFHNPTNLLKSRMQLKCIDITWKQKAFKCSISIPKNENWESFKMHFRNIMFFLLHKNDIVCQAAVVEVIYRKIKEEQFCCWL